jgi:tetratricopeptide (TPR) repeat protein
MNKEIQNNIQTSKIFTRFKKIPDKAFHDYYFFYQFYLPQINALEFEEYIEIKFNYIQALFHLDKYQQFYKKSDELITELLNYQNFEYRCKIIYEQVLTYKAEALCNENKLNTAQALYGELMRLNPSNKIYKRKLFYLLFQNEQIKNRKYVAIVVLFILLSLICTGISIFVIQPFFVEWSEVILISRDLFFASGIIGYLVLQGVQVRAAIIKIQKTERKNKL